MCCTRIPRAYKPSPAVAVLKHRIPRLFPVRGFSPGQEMDSMGFSDDESSGLGRASDEGRSSGSTRDDEPTSGAVEHFANLQDSKEEVPGTFQNCLPRGKKVARVPLLFY